MALVVEFSLGLNKILANSKFRGKLLKDCLKYYFVVIEMICIVNLRRVVIFFPKIELVNKSLKLFHFVRLIH